MTWAVERAQDEDVWFQDYLGLVLSARLPAKPPKKQRIGSTTVKWWDANPGDVVIMSKGGTMYDQLLAEQVVKTELQFFGYNRVSFSVDPTEDMKRTAHWTDIMAKAKRLIMSGQVQVLANKYHYVEGHVIGDHGEYSTWIKREDPNGRSITMWSCECPWDQYAWNRTRKWKKYEGRPCSHVMALYWKALATPLDEALDENQVDNLGTGQKIGPGAGTPLDDGSATPATPPQDNDTVFNPDGSEMPKEDEGQGKLFPPQGMPQPAPALAVPGQQPAAPADPTSVLPPFPGQMQMAIPPAMPGQTPGGMQAPPGTVSVPGARGGPNPNNPMQNPGTLSSVQDWEFHFASGEQFINGEIVRLTTDTYGVAEGPVKGKHGDGGYVNVPKNTKGEVLAQDVTTGWVECIFPLHSTGPHQPFHVRCFLEPKEIAKTGGPGGKTPFIGPR